MTRHDDQLIANCLRMARNTIPHRSASTMLDEIAENLIAELRRTQRGFDQDKCLKAVYKD